MTEESVLSRARDLVARMTLEEKVSQLRYEAPAIPRLGIPEYNWWNEALHGVARAGTATMFPQAIGMAATWDEPFVREIAEIIGTEGRAKYNAQSAHGDRDIYKGLTFWSPNVNIFRDPRWGRGHETWGEDPYLTARMGCAFVRGVQGEGEYLRAAACAKHFAVHSGPENLRHEFDAEVDPKDLNETYLYAFRKLVTEAGVEAVMGAYNRVNGEPSCGSHLLLEEKLRGEWGFKGHVVSDCGAIQDFHKNHRVTQTPQESAALAIRRGCDLNCGRTFSYALAAVEEGLLTEAEITRACERLMASRIRLGLFDEDCPWNKVPFSVVDCDEHAAAAQRAAEESFVLLKNDGILPLDPGKLSTVAVIGPDAENVGALRGNYYGTTSRAVTFLSGLRRALEGKARILYSEGSHLWKTNLEGCVNKEEGDRIAEAVICAEAADVVILCLGLDESLEGEEGDASNEYASGDKPDLELPAIQKKLLKAVLAVGKPVVTVVSAGSALRVEDGNAVLWTWYPGQAGGTALARILFGEVSPSGKLPVTMYRSVQELPEFTDYAMAGRTYRYFGGEALYPFGYGLSYTRFGWSGARWENGGITVEVKNEGAVSADAVTEVYVRKGGSPFDAKNPSLCGFARTHLEPGEMKTVRVNVTEDAFFVYNDAGERIPAEGTFTFHVGGSQPDGVSRRLTGQEPLQISVVR